MPPRLALTPDDLTACRVAWKALHHRVKDCPGDILRHPAVLRVALYAVACALEHGEPAGARPLTVYPHGDYPRNGGQAHDWTAGELAAWCKGQANGPARRKNLPPFIAPGASENGRRRNRDVAPARGVGWLALDCDAAGTWDALAEPLQVAARVFYETPSGRPDKWRVWLPLRHAWLPDPALVAREREEERTRGVAADSGFALPWRRDLYAAGRFVIGAAAGLTGTGFDGQTSALQNRFYPPHRTPEKPEPRRVWWGDGVSFDLVAAHAALVDLGVTAALDERRARKAREPRARKPRVFAPGEFVPEEAQHHAVAPIAAAIRALPYIGHPIFLALAGTLIELGVQHARVSEMLGAVAFAVGDPKVEDRVKCGRTTVERALAGEPNVTLAAEWPDVAAVVARALPAPPRRTARQVMDAAPAPVERVSIDDGRAAIAAGFASALPSGAPVLVRVSAGAGKSFAAMDAIAVHAANVKHRAVVLVQNYAIAREWVAGLEGRGVAVAELRGILHVYRPDGELECAFPVAVESIQRAGLNAHELLCRGRRGSEPVGTKCVRFNECSAGRTVETTGANVLVTVQSLAVPALGRGWEDALLVVDETPSDLVREAKFTVDDLRRAEHATGVRSVVHAAALGIVHRALADAVEREAAEGWTDSTTLDLGASLLARLEVDADDWRTLTDARGDAPPTHDAAALLVWLGGVLWGTSPFVPSRNTLVMARATGTLLAGDDWTCHHAVRALLARCIATNPRGAAAGVDVDAIAEHEALAIEREGTTLSIAWRLPHIEAIARHAGPIVVLDATGDEAQLSRALGRHVATSTATVREAAEVTRRIVACPEATRTRWCPAGRVQWDGSLRAAVRAVARVLVDRTPVGARVALATFQPVARALGEAWESWDPAHPLAETLEPLRGHLGELRVTYYGAKDTRGSNTFEAFNASVSMGDDVPNVGAAKLTARALDLPEHEAPQERARTSLGQWHERLRGVVRTGELLSIHVGKVWPGGGQWDRDSVTVEELPFGRPASDCDASAQARELVALAGSQRATGLAQTTVRDALRRPVSPAVRDAINARLASLRHANVAPAKLTELERESPYTEKRAEGPSSGLSRSTQHSETNRVTRQAS